MPPITATQMTHNLARVSAKLAEPSLTTKIAQLRQSRSNDALQQLQSQTIVDLYDAVRQIQDAIWPLLATIPDISGARDAAAAAAAAAKGSTRAQLSPPHRIKP